VKLVHFLPHDLVGGLSDQRVVDFGLLGG